MVTSYLPSTWHDPPSTPLEFPQPARDRYRGQVLWVLPTLDGFRVWPIRPWLLELANLPWIQNGGVVLLVFLVVFCEFSDRCFVDTIWGLYVIYVYMLLFFFLGGWYTWSYWMMCCFGWVAVWPTKKRKRQLQKVCFSYFSSENFWWPCGCVEKFRLGRPKQHIPNISAPLNQPSISPQMQAAATNQPLLTTRKQCSCFTS